MIPINCGNIFLRFSSNLIIRPSILIELFVLISTPYLPNFNLFFLNNCANKKLCDNEKCNICFTKSFASHFRSNFIAEKKKYNPRSIFLYSNKKYLFQCEICNQNFSSKISSITREKATWCPYCKNKTEKKLYDWLQNEYKHLKIDFQCVFDWCINNQTKRKLIFDFVIEEYKIIIELDGRQHFQQVQNWQSPESTQERDIYKMKEANQNGYTIIRLLQIDVLYDRNNWKQNLTNFIKIYDKPEYIFISKGHEYDNYINEINTF